ncbi:hypothetical protein TIFTF001_010810 [Ficus carica]|uniref:Uncharacterized protein n=1 Tax=Ficus carica TaxID=3494 RepID=A0AA88D073_FICCA|nr:hypothetical protein TIFTF001_010810 [Ficus carica]
MLRVGADERGEEEDGVDPVLGDLVVDLFGKVLPDTPSAGTATARTPPPSSSPAAFPFSSLFFFLGASQLRIFARENSSSHFPDCSSHIFSTSVQTYSCVECSSAFGAGGDGASPGLLVSQFQSATLHVIL